MLKNLMMMMVVNMCDKLIPLESRLFEQEPYQKAHSSDVVLDNAENGWTMDDVGRAMEDYWKHIGNEDTD